MVATSAVENFQIPGRRLGKRKTNRRRLKNAKKMGEFLATSTVPSHPAAVDYFRRVSGGWIMGRNDEFGTCGPVSVSNYVLCISSALADAPLRFLDDEIIDFYKRSGNPTFDPRTGRGDNGVDMTVMLSELVRNGIGFGTRNVKALAYAAIDAKDTEKLWAASALFGGVLWGAMLSTANESQLKQRPPVWDYVQRSRDWGGHAIFSGGRYSDQPGTASDRTGLITWDEEVDATSAFMARQVEECYVVLFPWHLTSRQFVENVDLATLASSYLAITGQPWPAVVPPPVQPPTPPAPPQDPPTDYTISDARLWEYMKQWGTERGFQ